MIQLSLKHYRQGNTKCIIHVNVNNCHTAMQRNRGLDMLVLDLLTGFVWHYPHDSETYTIHICQEGHVIDIVLPLIVRFLEVVLVSYYAKRKLST